MLKPKFKLNDIVSHKDIHNNIVFKHITHIDCIKYLREDGSIRNAVEYKLEFELYTYTESELSGTYEFRLKEQMEEE